jgi:hypothetical protein
MLVGQVQHALSGAQAIQGVVFQQPADQRLAGRADLGGFLPAPGRGAHVEGDLLISYLESGRAGDELQYGLAGS